MVHRCSIGVLSAAAVMALGGCPGDVGSEGEGEGEGAGEGEGEGEVPTIQMTWRVLGLNARAIEGVEVCVVDADPANCATTASTGEAVLTVPANEELAFRALKAGLVGSLLPIETGPENLIFTLFKVTETELTERATAFGVTVDPTKGTVAFLHGGLAPTGVVPSIAPASGDGPHYLGPTFAAQPAATELPRGGGALFFNVDPGTVTTSFAPAPAGCAFSPLAFGTEAASTTTPVEAGVLSGPPNILCE